MKPWLIYARVSTEEQASEGSSLPAQAQACRAMLAAGGITSAEVIEDAGRSGKDLDRPGVQLVLAAVDSGAIAGVCIYRLDRLTRDLRDLLDLVERFERAKVTLRSVSEMLDTGSPMGRFTVSLLGALAQWERETIAERVKLGMRHRLAASGYVGGPVPAGCRVVGEPGARVLEALPEWRDPAAEAWRRVADGQTLDQVCLWLESIGFPSPSTGTRSRGGWRRTTLSAWLANPRLIGLLIDRDAFDRCAAALTARTRPRGGSTVRATDRPYLLRQIAACGQCGAPLVAVSAHSRGRAFHYYRCSARNHDRRQCSAKDLPADELERLALEALSRVVNDHQQLVPHLGKLAVQASAVTADARANIDRVRNERDKLTGRLRTILDLVEGGGLAADAARGRLAELQAKAAAMDLEVARLEGLASAGAIEEGVAEAMAERLRVGVAGLAALSTEARQTALREIVDRLYLDEKTGEVVLELHPLPGLPGEGDGSFSAASWRSMLAPKRTIALRWGFRRLREAAGLRGWRWRLVAVGQD